MRRNVRCLCSFKLLSMIILFACILIPSGKVKADNLLSSEDLIFGNNYEVVCEKEGDYREYKIKLNESGKINFAITKEILGDRGTNGRAYLKDSSDTKLFDLFGYYDKGSRTVSEELLAGEYLFYVTAGHDNIKYSFTATFTPSGETASEFQNAKNNQVTTATAYTPGNVYTGHLADNDEMDIYKFDVTIDGFTTINYNPSFAGSSINLANMDGDVKYSEDRIEFGQKAYRYFTPAGTYYLTVSAQDKEKAKGTYTVSTSTSGLTGVSLKKLKSGKSSGTRYINVTYSLNPDATGYQICYSLKKNFKQKNKYELVNSSTTNKLQITNKLKKKKTYYVRVRAYREYGNGKVCYSPWSNSKKITTKK